VGGALVVGALIAASSRNSDTPAVTPTTHH
jgi:hypothetical protein